MPEQQAVQQIAEEKRGYRRVRAIGQCRVSGDNSFPLELIDIAENGAGIKSHGRLEHGEMVELDLFFPEGREFTATARVAWVQEINGSGSRARYRAGMRFVNISDDARRKIFEFIERESAADEAPSN